MIENWTPQDGIYLREFIAKCPNFKRAVEKKRPKCQGETVEASGLSGRERKGWDDALEFIIDDLAADQRQAGQDTTKFIQD